MNILLVGSGPSAFMCLKQLLTRDDLNITMIDNADTREVNNKSNCVYGSKSINTSRIKNEDIFENTNNEIKNLITKNFGGLSSVWGSSINEISNVEKEKFTKQNIYLDEAFTYLRSEMNFISQDNSFSNNVVNLPINAKVEKIIEEIHKTKKINASYSKFLASKSLNYDIEICNICNSYKIMCSQESLWSSADEIKQFIDKDRLAYLPNHKLLKFNENDNYVNCEVVNKHETLNFDFDYVFIAAGPFGTSEIFLNSNLVNKVTIQSSDLMTVPFITTPYKNINHSSHPELFFEDEIEEKLIFSQLYLYSDNLLKIFTNHNKFLSTFTFAPNIIKNIFGGLRVFLDPDISSKIDLTLDKRKNLRKNIEFFDQDKQKHIVSKHLKKYKDFGIFPFGFFKKVLSNGESYHFGSQFKSGVLDSNNCSDDLGRVNGLKKCFVVDSSVLPVVNTGPITYTSMANSYRITNKFLQLL